MFIYQGFPENKIVYKYTRDILEWIQENILWVSQLFISFHLKIFMENMARIQYRKMIKNYRNG